MINGKVELSNWIRKVIEQGKKTFEDYAIPGDKVQIQGRKSLL
jgi:hypothetical protein